MTNAGRVVARPQMGMGPARRRAPAPTDYAAVTTVLCEEPSFGL
ncbi:hypothetical protein STENM327S_04916 [Streptomyces tendae]